MIRSFSRPAIRFALMLSLSLCGSLQASAQEPKPRDIEFFETKIRPVLVKHCYECHGADASKVKGGLRLDSRDALRAGGDSGDAIVPGNVDESLLIAAIRYEDYEMPPEGRLSDEVIRDFEKWIESGAADPRMEVETPVAAPKPVSELWSLKPVVAPELPRIEDSSWNDSPVDRLLQASREAAGVQPVAEAKPNILLRRIYFDLIGLPPPVHVLDAFLADPTADTLQQIVDSLLKSPQFGERWARHWFDVVRYGESAGSSRDVLNLYAWRYRDYVIQALNNDIPYDRFLTEQLAGDLLPADSPEEANRLQIATGLLAIGSKSLNGGNLPLDIADDQIDIVGRTIMGLTIACARCHDHKYDPIPTEDYYALAGIFRSTDTLYGGSTNRPKTEKDKLAVYVKLDDVQAAGADLESLRQKEQELDKKKTALTKKISALQKKLPKNWEKQFATLKSSEQELSKEEEQLLKQATSLQALTGEIEECAMELESIAAQLPEPAYAIGVQDAKQVKDWPLQIRGEKSNSGKEVPRGYLTCILADVPNSVVNTSQSGRLELAQWLTSPKHPLTSRVMVNRVWQHLFGRGIVSSVDNFGSSGDLPSHPELLDYLASRFVHEHQWSLKSLIRELVLTRTYRLSTQFEKHHYEIDPENQRLWRRNRVRLEAEPLRDALLACGGNLNLEPFEGSLVLEIGEGEVGRNIKTDCLDEPFPYRSVYLPIIRGIVPEFLNVFDLPEPSNIQGLRDVTNVPAQALYMMNSPFVFEQAQGLAGRLSEMPGAASELVSRVYRIALSRLPTDRELALALQFLNPPETTKEASVSQDAVAEKTEAEKYQERWINFCHALFAQAEFRYLD